MTVVLTLNAEPLWLQAVAQQTLPVVTTLQLLTQTTMPNAVVSEPVTLEQVCALLPNSEKIILAYSAPETILAALLSRDVEVNEAAAQWSEQVNALLTLHRQCRSKLILLNLNQLSHCDSSGLSQLADAGWPLTQAPNALPVDVYGVVAAQLLQQPELQILQQRLQASSLALADDVNLSLDVVIKNYKADKTELQQVKKQFSLLALEHKACEQNNEQLSIQLALQHSQHADLNANIQQQVQQFTKLESELSNVQQALRKSNLEQQHLLQNLADAKQINDTLEAQLQHAKQISNTLEETCRSKQQALNEASQEQHDLLNQLLQTQEALEQHYLAEQQLNQQYTQAKQQAESVKKQCDELKAERELGQQLSQQQIQRLQVELKQVELQLKHALEAKQRSEQQLQQTKTHLLQSQSAKSEAQQESKLLLSELMNVQEMLEAALLEQQQQQQEHQKLASNNNALLAQYSGLLVQAEHNFMQLDKSKHNLIGLEKQHKRELLRTQNQLRRAKTKADEAEFKLANLQQDLKAIQSTKAWKIAAPVRAVSRLLHKEDKTKKQLQREVALVITSELFDSEWYVQTYADVANVNINPAEHYLRFGAAEGRRPGPNFDGDWYLKRYPDVAQTGINPLLHFVKFGRNEGRTASPKLLEDFGEQVD